jgi:DNA topoisomerase-2
MALTPELQWSVPSVIDGLNQGQRKILFASFKRNLVKDAKVGYQDGLHYSFPNFCI